MSFARSLARLDTRLFTSSAVRPTSRYVRTGPARTFYATRQAGQQNDPSHEDRHSTKPAAFSRLLYIAGLGAAAGLGAYLSASSSQSASQVSGLVNVYGTPADFQKAIDELKDAFPADDLVSTDVEDLEVHGSSDNDYHPGASIHGLSEIPALSHKLQNATLIKRLRRF